MAYSVPIPSIVGMFFSLITAVGVPISAMIYWRRKTGAYTSVFFIGAACIVVFAFFLENICHSFVLNGTDIQNSIWLYALYGAFAAAFFEEVGRYLTMKIFMEKKMTKSNGIMFGIGHGGAEAIILVGLSMISNLISSIMINTGAMEVTLRAAGDDYYETTMAALSPLWETASYMFYISGIERIGAIMLHISLAFFVYRAVSERRINFLFTAIGIHFAADFCVAIINNYTNVFATEVFLLAISAALFYYTVKSYKTVDTPQTI